VKKNLTPSTDAHLLKNIHANFIRSDLKRWSPEVFFAEGRSGMWEWSGLCFRICRCFVLRDNISRLKQQWNHSSSRFAFNKKEWQSHQCYKHTWIHENKIL